MTSPLLVFPLPQCPPRASPSARSLLSAPDTCPCGGGQECRAPRRWGVPGPSPCPIRAGLCTSVRKSADPPRQDSTLTGRCLQGRPSEATSSSAGICQHCAGDPILALPSRAHQVAREMVPFFVDERLGLDGSVAACSSECLTSHDSGSQSSSVSPGLELLSLAYAERSLGLPRGSVPPQGGGV